jgi:NAD(P)-dependent dehydrogenase (short-subunit alcohol dehydrogenase family)
VVHNAGIRQTIAISDLTEDDFAALLAVHLRGAVGVLQGAFASMSDGGNVTIITSGSGLNPQSGTIPSYAAAKAGVYGLMKVASFEGAPLRIRVNAISPVALTRMSERHLSTNPQADELEPDRVARVAVYLASDAARDVTGHVIRVVGRQICVVSYTESDPIEGDWTFDSLAEAIPHLLG